MATPSIVAVTSEPFGNATLKGDACGGAALGSTSVTVTSLYVDSLFSSQRGNAIVAPPTHEPWIPELESDALGRTRMPVVLVVPPGPVEKKAGVSR